MRGILVTTLFCAAAAAAEPGLTPTEIKIGACNDLKGPNSATGLSQMAGAKAYFDYVNAELGGVHGRKIALIQDDDSFDPDKGIACFRGLLARGVFAAGFVGGTPLAARYIPIAHNEGVPLVGFNSGAQLIVSPPKRWVFSARASYSDESAALVSRLWELGHRRMFVIFQQDAFGVSGLEGVKNALASSGSQIVGQAFVNLKGYTDDDIVNVVAEARVQNPDVVFMVANFGIEAKIVRRAEALAWRPQFVAISGKDAFVDAAGPAGEGTVIAKTMPDPADTSLPAVALYQRALRKYAPAARPEFIGLEGFTEAMILVEGLRRAGRELTRAKLVDALESMHDVDLGLGPAFRVRYDPTRHNAFDGLYFTVVRGGKSVPLVDWKTLAPRGRK